jgi:hypothetical protein
VETVWPKKEIPSFNNSLGITRFIGGFPRRLNGWQAAGESESTNSQPALTGASQKRE